MKKFIYLILILFIFHLGLIPSVVRAQSESENPNSTITVTPAKFDLSGAKGETIKQSLKISNNGVEDYIFAISIDNISATGENGEVIIGSSNPNLSNLLSSWVKFDQTSGTINGGQTKVINFEIIIPEDTEIGGKYASIVISMDKSHREPGSSQGVAKIVSLILLTISGGFEDNAKIQEFSFTKEADYYDFFIRFRNLSVNHIKPSGSIVISNFFGKKVAELSLNGDNVLPGTTRKISSKWVPNKYLFGYYTAAVVANYGTNQSKTATSSFVFYSFPIIGVISFIVLLVVIIVLLFTFKRKISSKIKRSRLKKD